jgi:FeS assembly protein SufD
MKNISLQHISALPFPTWNRLGVNDTSLAAELAEIRPYAGNPLAAQLPAGVVVGGETLPVPAMETGMGAQAAQFAESGRNCGVTVRVPAGIRAEQPVYLTYRLDETNPAVVDANTVIAEEGSEVTVVMSYSSDEKTAGFHGGCTRLYAMKNAVIHLVQVQLLNAHCVHFGDVGALTGENAEIDVMQAELGGGEAYAGCRARLEGKNSSLNLETIYFGDRKRSIDINYVAEHVGKKTHSEIHVNGALLDESQKTFRGTIDFVRGAKQAVGHESEYNLMFSPKVRNRTVPLILCAEEDVEGQHAASSGKIDDSKLFYLMSRGLDELAAKKLIIEAQFQPATDKIPDESLKSAISDYVKGRLNSIESLS